MLLPGSQLDGEPEQAVASQDHNSMGDRVKFIEQSVAALGAKLDKLLSKHAISTPGHDIDMLAQLDDVATRIDRMEQLLLRTPLPDFKVLDDTIASLLPHTASPSPPVPEMVPRDSGVNISINPKYIDQFYMNDVDEGDSDVEDAPVEVIESQLRLEHILPLIRLDAVDLEDLEESEDSEDVPGVISKISGMKAFGDEPLEQLVARAERGDLDIDCLADARVSWNKLVARVERCDLDIDCLADAEGRCLHAKAISSPLASSWNEYGSPLAGRVWHPWWKRAGVEDVSSEPATQDELSSSCSRPSALKPPSHICCIGGRKPHASVALTSLSAVYAYVHTMRAFQGGWEWAPLEAAPHLLHLCPVICSHQVYDSAEECLRASLEAAATLPEGGFGAEFDLLCLADALAVIGGGADHCACALQDIVEIFEGCLAGGGCGCAPKLRRGMKKLEFLTSFAFHHFELVLPFAAAAADFTERQKVQIGQDQEDKNISDFGSMIMPGMD